MAGTSPAMTCPHAPIGIMKKYHHGNDKNIKKKAINERTVRAGGARWFPLIVFFLTDLTASLFN
jgi:hypothetical protein